MGIRTTGIDRVLKINDIFGGKAAQVLAAKEVTLFGPVRVHLLHRIGIEMNIMTHLVKREMQRVLIFRTVDGLLI